MKLALRGFDCSFGAGLQFVDALSDLALRGPGRGLQPGVVDLREYAVLARHPAVAECPSSRIRMLSAGFRVERGEQVGDGAIERRRASSRRVWERCT